MHDTRIDVGKTIKNFMAYSRCQGLDERSKEKDILKEKLSRRSLFIPAKVALAHHRLSYLKKKLSF